MAPDPRALAPPRAPPPAGADEPLLLARAARDAALAEVTALDAEVEALAAELAAFAAALALGLGEADAEAQRAAGLVRRLQALADGLARELTRVREVGRGAGAAAGAPARPARAGGVAGARRGGAARAASGGGRAWEDDPRADGAGPGQPGQGPGEGASGRAGEDRAGPHGPEAEAAALRRVYRRLARLLHPDLAQLDEERARLSTQMARANAALAAGDLQALELMAEKLGAGEPAGDVTEAERLAHLARRTEQLRRVAASLARERGRLLASQTARLRQAAAARAAAGGDYFTESAAELAEEVAAARADALARLAAVEAAARALSGERRRIMRELSRRQGGGVVRGGFDPLAESGLVRRAALRLTRSRASAPARALARWLEGAAEADGAGAAGSRWEAGLTLLAFLLEAAGERPPPAVASAAGLAERWERLRPGWPGAPDLAGALARAPRHLVLGARAGQAEVVAGLQLAEGSLAAGVELALSHAAVAAVARQVFAALGPTERCGPCRREVVGVHVLRTSGLDERHGILCPRCGAVLRSYWRYGEPEGLEALWALALAVGFNGEVRVRLGDGTLGFGGRPEDLAGLTAGGLAARFEALYLEPCEVALPRGALRVASRGRVLQARARLAGLPALALRIEGAAGEGLVELLRTRIERRFRPGAGRT